MPASIAGVRQAVLVFTGPKASIYCLAIDGDDLYWSQDGVFQIMTMKLAGGAPVALATGLCSCMAVDATHVYFTDFDAGLVTKVPRAGGAPVVLASGQGNPTGIGVDSAFAYRTDLDDRTLHKVPLGGGADEVIGEGASYGPGVVVSGGFVTWVDHDSGSVRRMPTAGVSSAVTSIATPTTSRSVSFGTMSRRARRGPTTCPPSCGTRCASKSIASSPRSARARSGSFSRSWTISPPEQRTVPGGSPGLVAGIFDVVRVVSVRSCAPPAQGSRRSLVTGAKTRPAAADACRPRRSGSSPRSRRLRHLRRGLRRR